MDLHLAKPRGFCAGVERAIEIVETSLERFGPPIYVRHEIVHNAVVVKSLRDKGAIFVEKVEDVPEGAWLVFSAHGVPTEVVQKAKVKGLQVLDATCPLVTKVHVEARAFADAGYTILLVGHRSHVEVVGVVGEAPGHVLVVENAIEAESVEVPDPDKVAVLTQTTLSVDEAACTQAVLKRRFPALILPKKDDICYATQNRQDAVKKMAAGLDLLLVIGDPTSSNSNRLRELGESRGVESYLVLGPDEIDPAWLSGEASIGITSGASTPEISVQAVMAWLMKQGAQDIVHVQGPEEDMVFALPQALR
jgi:4-hydroxy-3-methylbut-2-en-1-yl diphosphate reductase